MSQFIDAKYAVLVSATGGNGSINDEELAFVRSIGSTERDLRDAWGQLLRGYGYAGSFNDMAYQWLGAQGHVQGTINERWFDYWVNGVVVLPSEYGIEYSPEYR